MTVSAQQRSGEPHAMTLRTLGATGLYVAGEQAPILGSGKPFALLAYLALAPGRRSSREYLIDLLWADLEPERARNALRQALFHLRRLVGDGAIVGTEELALTDRVVTDRDAFLAAADAGDLERAVELYGGPFLTEFAAPGGVEFEHWADRERERLRTAFLRCAEIVVRRRLNESRHRDAQRLARRARDECPDAELAWRLLLESTIAARDFVAASVEAEALERHAESDGIALESTTRQMIARARQISAVDRAEPAPGELVAELTGRQREFAMLTAAWDVARNGHARLLHITAPAGIGKSRLLNDVVARLRASGARVVQLRAAAGDRDIAYAFAGELAAALVGQPGAAGIAPASASTLIGLNPAISARLNGTPDSSAGEESLRRRIQALADMVRAIADEQPFVLAIDDLHWLDPQSFRVLEGVLARLDGSGVLCMTTARPGHRPADERHVTIELAALNATGVRDLVSAIGALPVESAWDGGFISDLFAATRGSPLLVLATLRLAMDESVLELADGEWHCTDADRLRALLRSEGALLRRVRALPAESAALMILLATAGTPIDDSILALARRQTAEDTLARLAQLERQGLVARHGGLWMLAHDEIGDAVRESAERERLVEAQRVLGAVLCSLGDDDVQQLARGIHHLVASGQLPEARRPFQRYVLRMRARHDSRRFSELASELVLGDAIGSRALVSGLPKLWRAGLWNRTRQGAAMIGISALVIASIGAVWSRNAAEALAPRIVFLDSGHVVTAVVVRAQDIDGRQAPIVPVRTSTAFAEPAETFPDVAPAISPDGKSVAWTKDVGDVTTLDIWLRTSAGTRRLTTQARDDLVHHWLPDGSALIGLTNRWSPPAHGNYDVAIFDTASGAARQVTSGLDHDGGPAVSPDGTRIVFIREGVDGILRFCVIPFDGIGTPDCRRFPGTGLRQLVGWAGLDNILVVADSAGTSPLTMYDWTRNVRQVLLPQVVLRAKLSPDRKWLIASLGANGIVGLSDWIVPLDAPQRARRVERPNAGSEEIRWWEGRPDNSMLVDRVEFGDTASAVSLGVTRRLWIRARTAAGTEVPIRAPVRWSSSDTLIATVDSLGDVHPRAVGPVTIAASLAGWRSVARALDVRGTAAKIVLDERWNSAWRSRWIPFGDPAPTVEAGPGGLQSFYNRGDGTFQSMAISRQAWRADNGLGLEVKMSTPITRDNWQRMRTLLVADLDTVLLNQSDQHGAPKSLGRLDHACAFGYPVGPGVTGRNSAWVAGVTNESLDVSSLARVLESGAWWTLRLQILPDGRCGIAVNNTVVWISANPIPRASEFRVRIGEESAETKILHGPLQVWTGVRTDIDWSVARP